MLARPHRFHGHQAVRNVYRQGRSVRGSLISLHVQADERVTATKVAVVVSKKVHKSAVQRNRIRRRIYEVVRLHHTELVYPAHLVLTIYSAELATMPSEELQSAVLSLLAKAELLKKSA
jgi:ribonuclease P protein component